MLLVYLFLMSADTDMMPPYPSPSPTPPALQSYISLKKKINKTANVSSTTFR